MQMIALTLGLIFVMTVLGAGFGIIAAPVAVAIYLVLIALGATVSVYIADTAAARALEHRPGVRP